MRKLIAGFLYGVTATDAPTFVAMLLLFAAVAFLAAYIPKRHADEHRPGRGLQMRLTPGGLSVFERSRL
jgi:hypothetical protein